VANRNHNCQGIHTWIGVKHRQVLNWLDKPGCRCGGYGGMVGHSVADLLSCGIENPSNQPDDRAISFEAPLVCTENSNSDVVMVKPAEDRV
jgi:hypothetical protein